MLTNDYYDLIVIGGGTAGTLCAIAAARSGLKTAVIERNSWLGGMACGSGLTEMNAAGFQSRPLYHGLEEEIFNQLIESGHGEYHFAVPMSSNKEVKVDRLRYDPEILKVILEEKAVSAGVDIFYDSELTEAEEREDCCRITVRNLYTTWNMEASYLADASGNANLIRTLGGDTIKTPEEKQLTSTLMFRISGVDIQKLNEFLNSGQLPSVIREGLSREVLKGKILALTPIPGSRDVSVNATRAQGDYEDSRSCSRSVIQARSQILPILEFIKEQIPGAEEATLSSIAPFFGVRDGRRIHGAYKLTLDDLENMTRFEDSVACGCYPMDIHDPVTNTIIWKVLPGVYHIPYRSLLPVGFHRTLVIGKCLAADKEAFAAIRVMPIMMNVGESAGYLFRLAKERKCCMDELNAEEIREYLDTRYLNN